MPFAKLWNTIRGRSSNEQATESSADSKPARRAKAKASSGRGLFSGGPHAGLCKLIKSTAATSVLEIGVGNGERAIAVLETLQKRNNSPIRYFAIDQFELTGGPISLKQFHQRLRASGIRPKLFPETIGRGLTQVAHTVGTVDLVVIADQTEVVDDPAVMHQISRISHAKTRVLCLRDDSWSELNTTTSTGLKRAA